MNIAQSVASAEPGPSWDNIIPQLLLMVFLTAINAFFAASEIAMVSIDETSLKSQAEDGDKKAIKILQLLKDPSHFLSVIQIGITLAGFFNSASAATGISKMLGSWLASYDIPNYNILSTVIITLMLSYLTIVLGELVPKRVAMVNPENFAKNVIGIITIISKFLSPVVSLLSISTNRVLKILGVDTKNIEEQVTLNDLKSLVQVGQQQGLINKFEGEIIHSVIKFDDKYAEEIMTPRTEVFMIDINEDPSEYRDEMMQLKYSRIPVYKDDVDNVIGVLYIKDYFAAGYEQGFNNINLEELIRPAYFIPERKNINDLFNELKTNNLHMSILIDEYGGFTGIVTMEDLIEEILGDIDDEYDHDIPELIQIDDTTFICDGTLSIKELNFNTDLEIDEETEDFDTLGGLIIYTLGRIPKDGEKPFLEFEDFKLFVLAIEDKRIKKVRVVLKPKEDELESSTKDV